jgi:glycosyltransferase involved in cell wall biosynthesis
VRIVYVGPVPPIQGGVSQHGGRLVQALRADGHEVELLSWRAQYPRFLYRGEQADVRRDPNPYGARFTLSWWNPLSWWSAGRAAARADLVVFPWITPVQAIPLRTLLQAAGATPSVCFVHNVLPHEPLPLARPLTRLVLGRVDAAVVHSQGLARELSALTGLERITVVGFPSQLDLEPTPLPPDSPLRLLFLGFVRPYKGLATAVEALRLLRERGLDARLTVVGEFWEPVEDWRARLSAAGLEEAVELVPGYASDDEVARHLREHHLVVAPYHSATNSGVIPLALAAGRGIVATNVGGLPEHVEEGRNGTLSPARDPLAFAAAIERAAERREELGRGAAASQATWTDAARALTRGSSSP